MLSLDPAYCKSSFELKSPEPEIHPLDNLVPDSFKNQSRMIFNQNVICAQSGGHIDIAPFLMPKCSGHPVVIFDNRCQ